MKKILLSLIVLAGLGGFTAYKMWNKPHLNVAEAKAIVMKAEDLLDAFKNDETAAGTKFINKVVAVTGNISNVKKEGDQITLQIETSDPMSNVICNLDQTAKQSRLTFNEGEAVQINGICSGYLSDVILDRCVVVK
jgi:hypothetical protein